MIRIEHLWPGDRRQVRVSSQPTPGQLVTSVLGRQSRLMSAFTFAITLHRLTPIEPGYRIDVLLTGLAQGLSSRRSALADRSQHNKKSGGSGR